jgi:glycosyltransferase involved in cell wall biosynthesis
MKTIEHFWSPSHCALVAGLFGHAPASAAPALSRVADSLSQDASSGNLPDHTAYQPDNDRISAHNDRVRSDNDRISSDIDRIILPKNPHLTHVISETYDFLFRNRARKNLFPVTRSDPLQVKPPVPLSVSVSIVLQVLFLLSATVYSVMSIRALWCLRHARRLPPTPTQSRPRVSVIFAARDEADRVENTVRDLLAQQGVDPEIIAVDDRSRDQTGEILKKLSQQDPRVRPKRVDSLPEDWLGKCHACHIGVSSATGEWLLFTDADCWLKPDVLARAVAVAESESVQHITLTPGVSARTIPAEGWHIAFLITVADWIARTNTDHPRGYLGVGAFNLVRADTYRKFGGHETLRLTVVDDVKLGKLVRKVGARTRAFIGGDDVECHWGVTVRHIIKIMEKNYFAAADYRIAVGLFIGPVLTALWTLCIIGPFTSTFLGFAAGLGLLSIIAPSLVLTRLLRWKARAALATPFVFPALFYAIFRSTVVTLKQGGIRWRDTFYPLDKLRAGDIY